MNMKKPRFCCFLPCLLLSILASAQHQHEQAVKSPLPLITNVEAQPLLSQVTRLNEALTFLGSSLSEKDAVRIRHLEHSNNDEEVVKEIQDILDSYCLAMVDINPEARVKVLRGPAKAKLIQNGWTSFLIKVHNDAGVTAKLEVESSNAAPVLHISSGEPRLKNENSLTKGQ